MKHGFIKAAAAAPAIRTADPGFNAGGIISLIRQAEGEGVDLLVFPELCITGSTCGDLFFYPSLLEGAEQALLKIAAANASQMAVIVGLPIETDGAVRNAAAVLQSGRILRILPKLSAAHPFQPGEAGLLPACPVFRATELPGFTFGVEIGDDFFIPCSPAVRCVEAGASIIVNPWAGPGRVLSQAQERQTLAAHSERLICGYVRASAGDGESTTDLVFRGGGLIAEAGRILTCGEKSGKLLISEIDVDGLQWARKKRGLRRQSAQVNVWCDFHIQPRDTELTRPIAAFPFVPEDEKARLRCCEEVLDMQARALGQRLAHTGVFRTVIGLSGGLDSTLALLAAVRTMDRLNKPRDSIVAVTMPCFGTTERTRDNAELLADALGVQLRTVDISNAVLQHFSDIGHAKDNYNTVYENAQARERVQVLMDIANQVNGLVVGTGDLSELALGWCTYGGDHLSMYAVNASIPKTLVREVVAFTAEACEDPDLAAVLADILDTPVSPELLPLEEGRQPQETESLIGPYALHDFFLWYGIGQGHPPEKVLRLAERAFQGTYTRTVILRWMRVFYTRFFSQQFKRSMSPDGPGITAVSLSPRYGLRMPSDASAQVWLRELDTLS